MSVAAKTIDSKKVSGRRTLTFRTWADVLRELDTLENRELQTQGNWSVGQIALHLAIPINGAVDGMNFRLPWYLRIGAKVLQPLMLRMKMPAGFKLPADAAAVMVPQPTSKEEGFAALRNAIARIQAARAAIDASGTGALLVARTEAYLNEIKDVAFAIERLKAFSEAGADCLFAPGMTDAAEIAETVKAVAPKPVNVLIMNPDMRVADLAALGVRRVSVGGALAAAAWRGFDAAAAALAEQLA